MTENSSLTIKCCDFATCSAALADYLNQTVLTPRILPGPDAVCWEHQADENPIRLTFCINVF